MRHEVRWHTAAPLWDLSLEDAGIAPERFGAPTILRFVGDAFMDELEDQLASEPGGIATRAVRAESWQDEQAGWQDELAAEAAPPPKLYHPAHNRFYLVAASLVCQLPGLPERKVDAVAGERASFVLRRLEAVDAEAGIDLANPESHRELAWLVEGQSRCWAEAAPPDQVQAKEEHWPLAPTGFRLEERRRRLLVGLVPVGSRELFEAGTRTATTPLPAGVTEGDTLADPRIEQLNGPIGALGGLLAGTVGRKPEELREVLVLALADLVRFLEDELPALWAGIENGDNLLLGLDVELAPGAVTRREALLRIAAPEARAAIDRGDIDDALTSDLFGVLLPIAMIDPAVSGFLSEVKTSGQPDLENSLIASLDDRRSAAFRDLLERPAQDLQASAPETDGAAQSALAIILLDVAGFLDRELSPVWQAIQQDSASGLAGANLTLFDLLGGTAVAGRSWRALLKEAAEQRKPILLGGGDSPPLPGIAETDAESIADALGALVSGEIFARVDAALVAAPVVAIEPAPLPPGALYIIRCVYERPRCARFEDPVVSAPSAPFRLANFFDPDATIRPIRISMPIDTSIAGLRRAPKGMTLLLSDKLRQQIARVRDTPFLDLADDTVGTEPTFNLGMMCSLSIPIVTICALILLMIVVQILNIVFWWLPYFKTCLPLDLRAK